MTASAPEKSMTGQVIAGKYRVDRLLGSGGMGIVLAATHLDLGRVVAVKLMRSELVEHPWAVDRLLREAKLAAQFRGEHMCRVLDVGLVADGTPYIVMEYLEGSDLATLLAEHHHFEIETAVDFMLQTAEALAEAHAANIIHRDLKPENLFVARKLDGTPIIKVLDFGISKQVGALSVGGRVLTNPSAALGSPFYMAPEQMRSARDVDPRADLWAVGTILFELLTGSQAFQGESLPEVCGAVMSTTPPRASQLRTEVPEELSDAIAHCLEKDPTQRFSTILELASAIAPFGPPDALERLDRIERVLSRSVAAVGKLSLDSASLLIRPSGIRLTPSGTRPRAPSAAGAETLAAPRIVATPTPEPLEAELKPKGSRWLAALLALSVCGALGVGAFAWRRAERAASTGPAPTIAALPVAAPPKASLEPSAAPAPVAPVPSASASNAAAIRAAPPPARSPTPSPTPPAARAVRAVLHAAKPPPAQSAASAPITPTTPTGKKPDVAAAWDTSNFGPRH